MRVFNSGAAAVLLLTSSNSVLAAPRAAPTAPGEQHPQLTFASPQHHHHDEGMQAAVLGPAVWIGSKIADAAASLFGAASTTVSDKKVVGSKWSELLGGDSSTDDKTIWDIINENEHLTQLKHVLNYSSDATKDLLANSSDLTLFAPVNQHFEHHGGHGRHGHHGDHMVGTSLSSGTEDTWLTLHSHIQAFESDSSFAMFGKDDKDDGGDDEDDDKRRERRRKILTHIIDAVIRYHLVDSSESLTGRQLADNSSVATKLHVSWKKLNDAQPWRVKISQQLLPFPSIKLNYYSTVIKADVKAKNGLIHAVRFPLLPPPSLLQMLYFASPELSGTAAGLLKTGGHGYLALPKANATQSSSSSDSDLDQQLSAAFSQLQAHHEHRMHGYPGPGTAASTFIVPSNWAWRFLPPKIKLFLLSPFGGERWLAKLFMLHALPHDIVFADSVHHVKAVKASSAVTDSQQAKIGEKVDVEVPMHILHPRHPHHPHKPRHIGAKEWKMPKMPKIPGMPGSGSGDEDDEKPHPPHRGEPHRPPGHRGNVTNFEFDSALPKIDWKKWEDRRRHRHHHGDDDSASAAKEEEKPKFEKVKVDVWRYHILPGGKGPLQTRIVVQGEPVWYQDIPAANGVSHVVHRFIMPQHLKHHHGGEKSESTGVHGLWSQIAKEAERAGYGNLEKHELAALGL